MKPARLIVAGIAVFAGLGAAVMLAGRKPPPPAAPLPVVEAPAGVDVLVARTSVPIGGVFTTSDIGWVSWPEQFASGPFIRRTDRPEALTEYVGAIARQPFAANEPIRDEKVVKSGNAGFLSAILPSGKRALAINIDSRGATSAGGFILPNDHVDVIVSFKDEAESERRDHDVYASRTLLKNIRVLAIGQKITEKDGEKTVIGETATLELDPEQAEDIITAQRQGALSLALRSLTDISHVEAQTAARQRGVTIIRYGAAQEGVRQ